MDSPIDRTPTRPTDPLLAAIVLGRRAWTSEASLVRSHGRAALRSLAALGWVERWAFDSRGQRLRPVNWTLTTWGASALEVELDERPYPPGEDAGDLYWADARTDPGPIVSRPRPGECRARFPELLADRSTGPVYVEDLELGTTTRDASRAERLLGHLMRIDAKLLRSRRVRRAVRRRSAPDAAPPPAIRPDLASDRSGPLTAPCLATADGPIDPRLSPFPMGEALSSAPGACIP